MKLSEMTMENIFKNCDCLEGMKEIPDKSIDMILTDLPYGTTRNGWDVKIPFVPLWEQYKRVAKENAAIVLFSQMPFTAELVMSNLKDFRYAWIWEKSNATGFLNAKKMPMKAHEIICVFYQKLPVYNPQMTTHDDSGKRPKLAPSSNTTNYGEFDAHAYHYNGLRYPRDVIKFSNAYKMENVNATQKPLSILEYLIKTYSNVEDVVLDSCAGSGSTGIACHNAGRKYIMFEKDPETFKKAVERVERETAQNNLFSEGLWRWGKISKVEGFLPLDRAIAIFKRVDDRG